MKKYTILLLLPILFLLSRCGINKQLEQAKALEKCHYDIISADSIYLAGINTNQFKDMDNINVASLPRLAMGIIAHNVPLNAKINLKITNNTGRLAAMNQFEYKILLRGNEIFTGFVNQKIVVTPGGGEAFVPIKINTNVYRLITDDRTREAFSDLVQNLSGAKNVRRSVVTFKIKPTLDIGNKEVRYPGYISIDKEFGK